MAIIPDTSALITKVLVEHHQILETKVSDATRIPLRVRIKGNAQGVSDENWGLRDWTFTYVQDVSLSLAANVATKALPAGWESEGRSGFVWLNPGGDARQLTWRPLREVKMKVEIGQEKGVPELYAVLGLRTLIVYPIPNAATPLGLFYKAAPPTLVDIVAPGDGLDMWPESWRQLVLYNGTLLQEMVDKGDQSSAPFQMQRYRDGVFSMCQREATGRPEPSFMPSYSGSAAETPELEW